MKVVGINLTSIGLVNPEEPGYEELRTEIREEGIYKKLVIQNGVIVGAIWIGTKEGVSEIGRLISTKRNVTEWKDSILKDDFDFSLV